MPKHNAYVIHPTYRIIEQDGKKQAIVHLWIKLENGKSALIKKPFTPHFFIPKDKEKEAKDLELDFNIAYESSKLKSMQNISLTKVSTIIPGDVPKIRKQFEMHGIECLEADIRFSYRAMMDWEIFSTCQIDKDPKEEDGILLINDPNFSTAKKAYQPKLTTLSFDIESDKYSGKIYCISCYTVDHNNKVHKKAMIVSTKKVKNADHYKTEKELIEAFASYIQEIDPDIITGWNVIDFDLNHLKQRAEKTKAKLLLGRDKSPLKLRLESSFFRDSKAQITGRVVIDGIAALKGSFIKLDDYKLATAAKKYTTQSKLIETTGKEKYEEITHLYEHDKEALIEYNILDAILAYDVLKNSNVLDLYLQRSLLTGMPLDRINASIAVFDSIYLRELRKKGYVAPSVHAQARDREGIGGFVMKSKPGIYDYVIVCDFKSLYPSIMRTFNIDPLMYVSEEKQKKYTKKDLIHAPNGAAFKREIGIVPSIMQNFWEQREQARKNKNELARYAIKIHMNSIYGVLASPSSRFFNRKIGNSITGYAHQFIKMCANILKEEGYDVIYGDTDSLFIDLKIDTYEKAQTLGKKIETEINTFLKSYIKKEINVQSFLELEFEKTFIRFVMPKVRGSEAGAKKRYAGLIKTDHGEDISFTGLEMVRRDWTDLAKEFQHTIYMKIFKKEPVEKYVNKIIKELKAGKLDDKLIYKKALRKDISQYTKTTPPHVKAAMLLKTIESSIIEYVITLDGPQPVQNITSKIDYDHYIKKQLKPIADSILSFYGTSFEDQIKGSKQKSLFDYG